MMISTHKTKLFGLNPLAYCGVLALSTAALSAHGGTITWNGAANGVSTFNEGNWVVTDDTGSATLNGLVGSAPPAGFVEPATAVEADVVVGGSATAGGGAGAGNHFDLGDGFSLTVQDDATFRMRLSPTPARGIRGVSGGGTETLTISDTADVITQFLLDVTASMSGASTLTFGGGGNGTLNNSTLELAPDWTGTVTWNSFDITGQDILNNITVGGQAAVDGVNVQIVGDGSSSTLVIPEPGSLALLALGGLAVARRRRA